MRARSSVTSGASSAPDGGEQRVDAPAAVRCPCAGPARPGWSPEIVRDDVARAVGAELRAEHDDAARQVAAQARRRGERSRAAPRSGRARTSSRNEPRRFSSTSSRASSIATSVSDGDRRDVEELARRRRGALRGAAQQQDGADRVLTGRDRRLGDDARGHLGRAAADLLADVAPELLERLVVGLASPPPPSPRAAARRSRRARRRHATRARRPAPAPRRRAPPRPSRGGPRAGV